MIKSYLKSVMRHLFKERSSLIISITGLVIGLVTSMLILLYIKHELSYDAFHENADWIFRVYSKTQRDGTESTWAKTPSPLGEFLLDEHPQIRNTVRILPVDKTPFVYRGRSFYEDGLILADPSLFKTFSFPLQRGAGLDNPNALVITQSMAKKYFGEELPLGKVIRLGDKVDLVVNGLIDDPPSNSHFHFDFVAPLSLADTLFGNDFLEDKFNTTVYTYLHIAPDTESILEAGIENAASKYFGDQAAGGQRSFHLQPVRKIHLYSDLGGEHEPNSSIEYVKVLAAIALIVLFAACVNHINLSIAVYNRRIQKIGMIKVVGANRSQLMLLFFMESFGLVFLASALSLILANFLLPFFNSLVGQNLSIYLIDTDLILVFGVLALLISLIISAYPSLFISGRKPKELLNSGRNSTSPASFGRLMVTLQFTISILLIIVTASIKRQMDYIQGKDLGFTKEALVVLPLTDKTIQSRVEQLKNGLMAHSSVLNASAASDIPGGMKAVTSVYYEGLPENEKLPNIAYLNTDAGFIETFGAHLDQGRNFSLTPGERGEYIVNEAAVKFFGWHNPVGKELTTIGGGKGTVIGVLDNFHFKSLHSQIEPLFLSLSNPSYSFLFVRINTANIRQSLAFIEKTWKALLPEFPYDYFFYDRYFDQLYKSELQFSRIALTASVLSIFITCLGLFALASFSSEQRKKEIALRKVFGAPIENIMVLLSGPFVKIAVAAQLIAWPFAFYSINEWLKTFAYHNSISWWVFACAGVIVIVPALFVVTVQSLRAARVNPIDWIRYE